MKLLKNLDRLCLRRIEANTIKINIANKDEQ
jgi:hypothetical protein